MKKAMFLLTVFYILLSFPVSAMMNEEGNIPSKTTAQKLLPSKKEAYTADEILGTLKPYIPEKKAEIFKRSISLMFSENFGQPKHPNSAIIKGWQCLLEKLIDAKGDEDLSQSALFDLLALHKNSLKKLDSELFGLVDQHAPCNSCLKSARNQYIQ